MKENISKKTELSCELTKSIKRKLIQYKHGLFFFLWEWYPLITPPLITRTTVVLFVHEVLQSFSEKICIALDYNDFPLYKIVTNHIIEIWVNNLEYVYLRLRQCFQVLWEGSTISIFKCTVGSTSVRLMRRCHSCHCQWPLGCEDVEVIQVILP